MSSFLTSSLTSGQLEAIPPKIDERKKITVQIQRESVNLRIPNPTSSELQSVNIAWGNFNKKDRASPDILEGAYTIHQPSAMSIRSLVLFADQLLQDMQRSELDFSEEEKYRNERILSMRAKLNTFEDGILLKYDSNPATYLEAARKFLQNEQLSGFVASKSRSDFGKMYHLTMWNWICEQWVQLPNPVLVCDIASNSTFRKLRDKEWVYDRYDANMRWVIEIAPDVLALAGIPTQESHGEDGYFNVSSFVRAIASPLSETYQPRYPEYLPRYREVHPSFGSFGHRLSQVLSRATFHDKILSLQATPPKVLDEKQYGFTDPVDEHTLLPWILYQEALSIMRTSVEDAADPKHVNTPDQIGIPIGNFAQYQFAQILYEAGIMRKRIITQEKKDSLDSLQNTLFFVEKFQGGYNSQVVIAQGLSFLDNDNLRKYAHFANGKLMISTQDQLEVAYLQSQITRIVHFA